MTIALLEYSFQELQKGFVARLRVSKVGDNSYAREVVDTGALLSASAGSAEEDVEEYGEVWNGTVARYVHLEVASEQELGALGVDSRP